MIKLITFASPQYSTSAARLKMTALKNGADEVKIYSEPDLDPFFRNIQRDLFEGAETRLRGAYYAWKPYVVLDAILKANEGDILVYIDAGNDITASLQPCIDSMDDDIFLFSNGWQHSHWCKQEVAWGINGESYYNYNAGWWEEPYFEFKQVQASAMFFKVSQRSIDFVKEWYAWSIMPGMIDNILRGEQFPEFQEHRYDQAILTCVQIKWGLKLHWFPAVMNQHQRTNEGYDTFLDHHRKTNDQW